MRTSVSRILPLVALLGIARQAEGQDSALPKYLRDRGTGVPASIFGTYIRRGELLVYPFLAYTRDHNREYNPTEFGFPVNQDFKGKFRSTAEQLFIGYGVTDWLAIEFEAAHTKATLDKSSSDPSGVPTRIEESGFNDFEGQIRVRLMQEGAHRPEVFGWVEMVAKSQSKKLLINEPVWDLKPGLGVGRGFGFGTVTVKIAAEYNREEGHPILGEVTIEYLKRLSPSFQLFLAIEGGEGGAPDEFDLVSGLQVRITDRLFFKFDNAIGLSPKAPDWAPQVGLMLSLPK